MILLLAQDSEFYSVSSVASTQNRPFLGVIGTLSNISSETERYMYPSSCCLSGGSFQKGFQKGSFEEWNGSFEGES